MRDKKQIPIILIIVVLHLVGIVGFKIPSLHPLFIRLVPVQLCIMFLLMLLSQPKLNGRFFAIAALIAVMGFCIEWVGVTTRIIFGDYAYGGVLGIKLAGVPLLIGINWFLLTYGAGSLVNQFAKSKTMLSKVLAGAVLMVLADYLLEPLATHEGYWNWHPPGAIPVQNYVAWFLTSFLFQWLFQSNGDSKTNGAACVLFFSQLVFFIALTH